MARRLTRPRFVRPAPKTKVWLGLGIGTQVITASTIHLLGVFNAAALATRPFTILRTRMLLTFESDQISASERPFGGFGMTIANDVAVGVGITALPDPGSVSGDTDADWFVYESLLSSFKVVTAVGVDAQMATQYTVDSKAMRKVGPNDDLAMLFSEEGAVGAFINIQGRMLIQLH